MIVKKKAIKQRVYFIRVYTNGLTTICSKYKCSCRVMGCVNPNNEICRLCRFVRRKATLSNKRTDIFAYVPENFTVRECP